MTIMTLSLIAGAVLMAVAGGILFALAARRGDFDDIEDIKFQIFREEEADEQSQTEDNQH